MHTIDQRVTRIYNNDTPATNKQDKNGNPTQINTQWEHIKQNNDTEQSTVN